MLVLRFANTLFGAWWNRHFIANVQVSQCALLCVCPGASDPADGSRNPLRRPL